MKKIVFIVGTILFELSALAQITNIPDPDFEQALIDLGIDSDGIINGQVLTVDIEGVASLNVSQKHIDNLTGIEDFIALETLDISYNPLSNGVNLSNNTLLRHMEAIQSGIPQIDFSSNVLLEYIDLTNNELEELDLSNNSLLRELYCGSHTGFSYNRMLLLDLNNNPNLEVLHAQNIPELTTVKLRNNNNQILTQVFLVCFTEGGNECNVPLCVEVDYVDGAMAGEFPYSEWEFPFCCTTFSEECFLSIPSLEKEFVLVYPIPAGEEIFIHHQNEGEIKVSLYNLTGQLLLQEVFNHNNNQLDLKELPSGTYFLMIETPQGQKEVKKVVKN